MKTKEYFKQLVHAAQNAPTREIDSAVKLIQNVTTNGRTIFVCGNGGSAHTASHFVTDWAKMRWINKQQKFKAYCLSDNIGTLTAYSNDLSYADVFSEPLRNYAESGDLLIVVSGSGNSENVVKALEISKQIGMYSIGLCGYSGGKVKDLSDIAVHFPVNDMQIVEDLHLSFGHIVMKQLCE